MSMNKTHLVAYSYQDKFEISEKVAQALMHARDKGLGGVQAGDRYFSSQFMWILPLEETQQKKLTAKQMIEAGRIAEWLVMPIHELGWTEEVAIGYASKLVARVDHKELRKLDKWVGYEGSYANAKRFLMEAKQLENAPDDADTLALTSGE